MSAPAIVSDHAVLRFLERECGLDVERLRGLIGEVCARGADADAPVVRFGHVRFVLFEGKVVTAVSEKEPLTFANLKGLIREAKRRG